MHVLLMPCSVARIVIGAFSVVCPSFDTLLERCAANLDQARSWIVRYELSQVRWEDGRGPFEKTESGRVDLRGERVLLRSRTRQYPARSAGEANDVSPSESEHTLLWDGSQHVNYVCSPGKGPGSAAIDRHERSWEIKYIQRINSTGFLFGYLNNSFERVDRILRDMSRGQASVSLEAANGVECFAIRADTVYGEYAVWLDPNRGYSLTRATVNQQAGRRHMSLDTPLSSDVEQTIEYSCSDFREVSHMWIPMEVTYIQTTTYSGHKDVHKVDFRVSDFIPNPDANALGPFTLDFIPEGAEVHFFPDMQIQYIWRKGKPVAQYEQRLVKELDRVLDGMMADGTSQARPSQAANDPVRRLSEAGVQARSQRLSDSTTTVVSGGDANVVSTPSRPEPNVPDDSSRGPFRRSHCGLYCVYSIMRLAGQRPDFVDLVKPEYLGSYEGSSMPDLIRAAHDNGLFAVPGARLTPRVLRQATCPIILHVRGQARSPKYDHYELFLGTEEGKAKILNAPLAPQLVDSGELAAQWDGVGLIISDKAPDVEALFAGERYRLLMAAAVVVLAIVVTHGVIRARSAKRSDRSSRWRMAMSMAQGCVLAAAALTCGVCSNIASTGDGLVANGQGIHSVRRAHLGGFVRTIGVGKVRQLLSTDAIFVDARYPSDFQAGHLESAVSVPVRADDRQFTQATKDLPRDRQMVVYAHSRDCPYAKNVAGRLVEAGFHNIVIFKGGWTEWTAKNGKPVAKEALDHNGSPRS
jgi:rhodanese-related sulfurtransferase